MSGNSLFSFVDLKDPFTPSEIVGEDLPGPILSLMGARQFDFLFLFHTPHTQHKALATKSEIARRYPNCSVCLRELPISDPKDYSVVMARLAREVRDLVGQARTRETYVCVSSGTAEMRAAWFLLTAVGVLPAKLLQVGTPLFGQPNVKDIVDTRDWQAVRHVLMPAAFISSGVLTTASLEQAVKSTPKPELTEVFGTKTALAQPDELVDKLVDGARVSDKQEEIRVPGLDEALRELGIHVGSAVLRYAAERAGIAASSSLPVLLLGETGTGKERFAHLIHRLSPRSPFEMVIINCAAIPKDIAESHLFGHIKGSFSGATAGQKGVFEAADQNTLFLDEVAELPLEMQAKLLRVIQDGSFQRVGSTKPLSVNVRIIAATNRDLAKEVAAGRFREDLYFRLEVLQIKLPALRERRAEIPELALVILRQINQRRLKPRVEDNQLKKEVEDARLRVHADVISNWGILQSSGPAIASAQAAVAANKIALTGVREEEKVGQRTTLDVLDATRELLNSQIGLVSALRDRVVAEYSLYAAMGRMDAQTLGLPVPYYDPIEHYDIVKNKWLGLRPPAPPAPDE